MVASSLQNLHIRIVMARGACLIWPPYVGGTATDKHREFPKISSQAHREARSLLA